MCCVPQAILSKRDVVGNTGAFELQCTKLPSQKRTKMQKCVLMFAIYVQL